MQVVDQLKNSILPQAKELLNKAEREAGTTVPISFRDVRTAAALTHTGSGLTSAARWLQALETVVSETEKLLEQVGADASASNTLSGIKSTADGIEQQLIVFRQLFDVPDLPKR